MKKMILILSINLICLIQVFSNNDLDRVGNLLSDEIEYVTQIEIEEKENVLYIESSFGISDLSNFDFSILNNENTLTKIEYVYSTYKKNENFIQKDLDNKRLFELQKYSKSIFENDLIEWKAIAQIKARSIDEAKKMFHGFKVYYRKTPSEASIKEEISYLESYLDERGIIDIAIDVFDQTVSYAEGGEVMYREISENLTYPIYAIENNIQGSVYVGLIINEEGKIEKTSILRGISFGCDNAALNAVKTLKNWNPAIKNGKPISSKITIPINFSIEGVFEEPEYTYYDDLSDSTSFVTISEDVLLTSSFYEKPDSTLYKTFERNPNWNKMSVICDFTGSMSPYTAQLLYWHKMNLNVNKNKVSLFTFFNDGDFKQTSLKKIGSTGGIYQSNAKNFKEIKSLALKTMKNGGGGDCPENNIEATINAIEKCSDCEDLVMIADNYATPRDLKLLSKVDKPIKVIMCGTNAGINIDYLNMVKENGGSLHTIENDIINLSKYKENENIKIGKWTYRIFKNKFERVYNKSS